MQSVTKTLRWVKRRLTRMRSLIKGEDHDSWYDDHSDGHAKPPNVGPNLGSGGS